MNDPHGTTTGCRSSSWGAPWSGLSTSLFLGRLGVPHILVERHAGYLASTRAAAATTCAPWSCSVRRGSSRDPARPPSVLADNHGILQADR